MSTLLGPESADVLRAEPGRPVDASREAAAIERSLATHWRPSRWIGWRLRLLVLAALLGCVAVFLLARVLAELPHVDATWRLDESGRISLSASADPALHGREGSRLAFVEGADGTPIAAEPLLLVRSARWLPDDAQRQRHADLHDRLARWLDDGALKLGFADGSRIDVAARPRGVAGIGAMFWLLAALSLGMYLIALVVALGRPAAANVVYAAMTLCQAGNIAFIAVESTLDLSLPRGFLAWELPLRTAFDLVTAAAIVHAAALHPRRLPQAAVIAGAAWAAAAAMLMLVLGGQAAPGWWWTQGFGVAFGVATIALLGWSYRVEPHPFAVVMRRFAVVLLGGWILLTFAVAASAPRALLQQQVLTVGPVIWVVFFAALLLVMPFLSRSQQVLREFSMLAAVSTVATSLDLLFVAVFSLGQFTSLTLSLFLALGAYAGLRQWLVNRMLGGNLVTAERMFEQLYRIARDVEADPEQLPARLARLLRELFEPIELVPLQRGTPGSRVLADGSTLVVPVPELPGIAPAPDAPRALAVRFARRGRRLFTLEDARLTDRVVEQLQRAVAHDRAVEQGRSEERARLAQDLHDDIGARLLTLMYKAQSPEMEDYVRHTLQDLKTLTRGLAASSHRLSHAIAEWKADITQRLTAAHCELDWRASFERDIVLSVVQWSALTRVLRELVSNAIAHAQATRVAIELRLDHQGLWLSVSDDGCGRAPQGWSHGLGLGGVRKRVKQLGGEVEWLQNPGAGITCRVHVRELVSV
jgi:signal transduction histidine kinase